MAADEDDEAGLVLRCGAGVGPGFAGLIEQTFVTNQIIWRLSKGESEQTLELERADVFQGVWTK